MSRHSGGHRTCCFIATKDVTKTQKKPKTKMELGNDDVQKESHLPGFFFHVTCLGYKYALEIYNRYPAMMVWKRWLRLFWVAMLGCFRRIPVENYSYMMWMVRYSCLHTWDSQMYLYSVKWASFFFEWPTLRIQANSLWSCVGCWPDILHSA